MMLASVFNTVGAGSVCTGRMEAMATGGRGCCDFFDGETEVVYVKAL